MGALPLPADWIWLAAEFIASQFRRAGLEPAGDDGYFQTALFVQVTPNLDGFNLALESGAQTISRTKLPGIAGDARRG